jgi:tRNA threonylcarbamoyladenosine biosynthesis protein TsaB
VKFLAIETSSNACSVAVQNGDDIIENHVIKPREHTKILLPMIRQSLGEAALEPTDLDAVILGNGPGSFIGMRIGASVAQGICYGAGLKIVPISSLAAVAAEVMHKEGAESVVVAQDARMGEIYVGRFMQEGDGLPCLVGEEEICAVGTIVDIASGSTAAGHAWQKYDELVVGNESSIASVSAFSLPRASYLLSSGKARYECGGAILPEALIPAYLRTKVAEVPRDMR